MNAVALASLPKVLYISATADHLGGEESLGS